MNGLDFYYLSFLKIQIICLASCLAPHPAKITSINLGEAFQVGEMHLSLVREFMQLQMFLKAGTPPVWCSSYLREEGQWASRGYATGRPWERESLWYAVTRPSPSFSGAHIHVQSQLMRSYWQGVWNESTRLHEFLFSLAEANENLWVSPDLEGLYLNVWVTCSVYGKKDWILWLVLSSSLGDSWRVRYHALLLITTQKLGKISYSKEGKPATK